MIERFGVKGMDAVGEGKERKVGVCGMESSRSAWRPLMGFYARIMRDECRMTISIVMMMGE